MISDLTDDHPISNDLRAEPKSAVDSIVIPTASVGRTSSTRSDATGSGDGSIPMQSLTAPRILFAAQVGFGSLHRDVRKKELDLFQLSTCCVAEFRA